MLDPKLDLTFSRIIDVPKELVWRCWTEPKLLLPDYRPSLTLERYGTDDVGFMFTATIALEDNPTNSGVGTKYAATVLHADEGGSKRHAAMGFEAGWSAALDQMVAMIKNGLPN